MNELSLSSEETEGGLTPEQLAEYEEDKKQLESADDPSLQPYESSVPLPQNTTVRPSISSPTPNLTNEEGEYETETGLSPEMERDLSNISDAPTSTTRKPRVKTEKSCNQESSEEFATDSSELEEEIDLEKIHNRYLLI